MFELYVNISVVNLTPSVGIAALWASAGNQAYMRWCEESLCDVVGLLWYVTGWGLFYESIPLCTCWTILWLNYVDEFLRRLWALEPRLLKDVNYDFCCCNWIFCEGWTNIYFV